jgi:anthranilate phosphoribosyltransferase
VSTPADLADLDAAAAMRSVIARIATGPTQSKDISREEARIAMAHVLAGRADPVQAAIFLIALRMKRETDDEYRGLLDALGETLITATAGVDHLLDIADPFDGFDRCLPASPFLAPVLAACGLPALSRGLACVGPKHGLTHRQVLAAAGVAVDLAPADAARRIADPEIGWAYLDQRHYSPALHALVRLRALMVKRPAITTAERVAGPLRARGATHLALGYVHRAYPRIYAVLAAHAGYSTALLVRGIEGALVPSLRQPARLWHGDARGETSADEVDPVTLGIESPTRAPVLAQAAGDAAPTAATAGIEALEGAPGPTRDALVLGTALCLTHVGLAPSLQAGAAAARESLDSGRAAARLRAA